MSASSQKSPSDFAYDASDSRRKFSDARAVYIVSAKNWRLFAYGCLVVAILAVAAVLVMERAPREVPYVVSMNAQNEPMALGVGQMLSDDQRAEILITQYTLRQFVQNWRMVVPAPDFQAKMIADYVTPFVSPGSPAAATVSSFYQAANPYELAKKYIVEVAVDQPIPQTATTYELHWVETVRGVNNIVLQTSEWRAFATVAYKTPDANSVRLNPAGIQLTNLSVEQVTATNASPSPTP